MAKKNTILRSNSKKKIIREFYEAGARVSDKVFGRDAVCKKWKISNTQFDELVMPSNEAEWDFFLEKCIKMINTDGYGGNTKRMPSRTDVIEYLDGKYKREIDQVGDDIRAKHVSGGYKYSSIVEIASEYRLYIDDVEGYLANMNTEQWDVFLRANIETINEGKKGIQLFKESIPDHKMIEEYLGKRLLETDLSSLLDSIESGNAVDLVEYANSSLLYHKQLERAVRYGLYAKCISKVGKGIFEESLLNIIKEYCSETTQKYIETDCRNIASKAENYIRMNGFRTNILNINEGVMTANAGDAAQFLFISRAIMLGFNCSNVDVRSSRYDAVIDYNGILLKIQVKGLSTGATILFKDRDRGGIGNDSKNRNNAGKLINSKECDVYVVVDRSCGACYIIPVKSFVEEKLTTSERKNGIHIDEANAYFENWDIFREIAEEKQRNLNELNGTS